MMMRQTIQAGEDIASLYSVILLDALRAVRSHLAEALAAIDRAAFAGFEGYFGCLAALGAGRGVHLAGFAAATAAGAVTLGFSGLPAVRAALGLIGVAFGLEELLLRGAEGE